MTTIIKRKLRADNLFHGVFALSGAKGMDIKMKQIKNPLYGYIEVDASYIPIIDSAEFQRLRNIRQTGYASLYPSALHNRFVHSLGVFHLGRKAINNFVENVKDMFPKLSSNWAIWKETFISACLLHDIGHSPFSHTGEDF